MNGPRVSSGTDSVQDVGTPLEFIDAIERRFGRVRYDLAAHAGNAKHAIYIAPKMLELTFDPARMQAGVVARQLMRAGGHMDEILAALEGRKNTKGVISVPNHDPNPVAIDSFAQDWSMLAHRYRESDGRPGLGYLNCEFSDIEPWASKCREELVRGANLVLLTPLTCARWYRNNIAGRADVFELAERITFLGSTAPFAKDLMLSWFHPRAQGRRAIWSWKTDTILQQWEHVGPPGVWMRAPLIEQGGDHGGDRPARGSADMAEPEERAANTEGPAHPKAAVAAPLCRDGRGLRGETP